jgi:hypothetical protein
MRPPFAIAALVLTLGCALGGQAVSAPPCKDVHGKFVKCPPPKPVMKRCKDAHGKFTKCMH